MDARSLIAAAKRDAPPRAVETAVLGALGLGAPALFAPSIGWKLWAALKHAALSKVGVSVIAVAAASGGYAAGRIQERALHATPAPSATVQIAETRAKSAPTSTVTSTSTSTSTSTRPVTVEIVSVTTAARVAPVTATAALAATTPAPAVRASLADELDAIRRARTALLAGNDRDALVALDAYDTAHPHGTLEEESLALRVRATRKLGDDVASAKALTDLETRFPSSVHLPALRDLGKPPTAP